MLMGAGRVSLGSYRGSYQTIHWMRHCLGRGWLGGWVVGRLHRLFSFIFTQISRWSMHISSPFFHIPLLKFCEIFDCAATFTVVLNAPRSITMKDDGGMAQLVIAVLFGTLAVIAVVLRIISRRLSRVRLGMTDYMITLALVQVLVQSTTR